MKRTKLMISKFIEMMSNQMYTRHEIFYDDLPSNVKEFVQNNFPGLSIAFIEKKDSEYVVTLNDDTEIIISEDGNWERIYSMPESTLVSLLPQDIITNVKKLFSNAEIVSAAKNANGYEISLSNYVNLSYDRLGHAA